MFNKIKGNLLSSLARFFIDLIHTLLLFNEIRIVFCDVTATIIFLCIGFFLFNFKYINEMLIK